MKSVSPTVEGFRAAFRRPVFSFAEVSWRWALGATVVAVFIFYGVEFLDTLPVGNADAVLLASRQPLLMGRAIAHILRGSLHRAVFAALLAVLSLALLWIIMASVGRLITTRAVLEYFRRDDEQSDPRHERTSTAAGAESAQRRPMRGLIDLNFLRVVVVLAMMLALATSGILSSLVSREKNPRPDLAVILFLLFTGVIFIAGWLLNWWLSFAAIFAVRDGEDAIGAISAATTLVRTRTGAVLAVGTWTALAHLVAFSIATSAATVLLAFIRIVTGGVLIAGLVLLTLAYFAIVDWLYIARLAGYVFIAEMPGALLTPPPIPTLTPPALATTIDRNELILSDVPGSVIG